MERKAVSGIMLTLLLIGMLTLALDTPPVKANQGTIDKPDDNLAGNLDIVTAPLGYLKRRNSLHAVDLRDAAWNLRRYWSEVGNEYGSSISLSAREIETRLSSFVPSYKWDFGKAVEWRDFAFVDEDSAELVIGVNDFGQSNYDELANYLLENGGEFVDSVSIGDKIRAVVADVPFDILYSFVSEVETAGLASYIEPNIRYEIDSVPNDPEWPKQWGPAKMEADYAWNITTGDPSVLVAVIDTGIDWNHPDLAANYVPLGYDWANNDPDPMDDYGHGTHVAGTVAAVVNNGVGIAGLAQVRIMAEKVLDEGGSGSLSDVTRGIVHSVDQGAKIINLSLGSYVKSNLLHEAVKYAYDRNVLVVAAAGNDATSVKHYPAAYDEVVAVTATDESDNPASFTNYGDWVEVAAPGVRIYSTFWDDSYVYASGTSMSAPHVAGVAALIWSWFPSMTRDQVWAQLQYSADDLSEPGYDVYYGFGRVNARRAVEQAPSNHDLLVLNLKTPAYVRLGKVAAVNTTILNMGNSHESNIMVRLLVNSSVVNSTTVGFLQSGSSTTVGFLWNATIEGVYNITSHVMPVIGETIVGNNALPKQMRIRAPQILRVPDDYDTIQGAVDVANEGDTVFVASGTYYENLWINKEGLILVGEDVDNTVIDGRRMYDVIFVSADNVQISRFTIRNSGRMAYYYPPLSGILLYASEGHTISDTVILNNLLGIGIFYSSRTILRNNNITHNTYNFGIDGYSIMDFVHDLDASNTIKGKPMYYWVNQHDKQVPSDAGYVAIVNSTNIVVKDLNLTENFEGVLFASTVNSFIENVNASSNYLDIYLAYSHDNTVHANIATSSSVGIYLYESQNNTIHDNILKNNEDGIDLDYSTDNTLDLNKMFNNELGLYIGKSNNNRINSNLVLNNSYGLYLGKSSYNIVKNNNMTSNKYNFGVVGGHLVHFIHDIDTSNTVDGKPIYYLVNRKGLVIDPSTFPNLGYLGVVNSTSIKVENLTVTNNVQGILLAYTNGSIIRNINATSNLWGILMIKSFESKASRGTMSNNKYSMGLWDSYNNTINGNLITKGLDGIYLQGSGGNDVIDNFLTGNRGDGISLVSSGGNNIISNTVLSNRYGIHLYYSGGSVLRYNNMTDNDYNFGIEGYFLSEFIQDIDTSNTVDGKPIYYWANQHSKQVPFDAGYVAVINSTSIIVANLSIANNGQGILFAYTSKSIISGNNVANCDWDGIGLYYSDDNTIVGNTVRDTALGMDVTVSDGNTINSNTILGNIIGIYAYYSDGNIVVDNKVSGGGLSLAGIALTTARGNMIKRNEVAYNTLVIGAGIYLEWSSNNNNIIQNTLKNNNYGISLGYLGLYGLKDQNNNNTIYHNNFIENTQQALSLNSINTWDNGYPSGGNYWSNYSGTDNYSGPYQNLTGSDGIGDTSYTIDANNEDKFPYMIEIKGPYIPGDLNHDGKVNIRDISIVARAFGSYPGHLRWNPSADINNDNKVNIRDLAIIARNFGKTYL